MIEATLQTRSQEAAGAPALAAGARPANVLSWRSENGQAIDSSTIVAPQTGVGGELLLKGKILVHPKIQKHNKKYKTTRNKKYGPTIVQNQFFSTEIDAIDAEKREESKNNIKKHQTTQQTQQHTKKTPKPKK